ncbi:septum formation family protein [Nocardiopsis sp. NPDC049922]|uniref:septum formation family protein n=1 Tax=Nocardiopsis sp. NPDC049922 TaxID=3155157 RepID=UPI0033EA91A6
MLSDKPQTILGRVALGGLAAGAALALSACAPIADILGGGSIEVPDVDLETPAEGGEGPTDTDVFQLNIGDCFIKEDLNTAFMSGDVSEVPILDCAESHDSEIFYTYDIAGDTYPGEEAVSADVSETCAGQAFTDFIGVEYANSEFLIDAFTPTEDGWNTIGDREVICYVKTGELVTGTLEGANR